MPPDTRPVNDRAQVTTPVGGEEREHGRRRTPGRKTFRQTSGLEIARAGDISAVPTPDFLIFGYQPLTPFPSIHSHVENQRERPPCPRTWRSQRSAERFPPVPPTLPSTTVGRGRTSSAGDPEKRSRCRERNRKNFLPNPKPREIPRRTRAIRCAAT